MRILFYLVVAIILLPAVASVAGTLLLVLLPILLSVAPFIIIYYVSSHILNTSNLALGVYSNVSDAEYTAAWFAYRATTNLPTGFRMTFQCFGVGAPTYTSADIRMAVFNARLEMALNTQKSKTQLKRSALGKKFRNGRRFPTLPNSEPIPSMSTTNNEYEFPIGPHAQNRGPARVIIRFTPFGPAELMGIISHDTSRDHTLVITTTSRSMLGDSGGHSYMMDFVG